MENKKKTVVVGLSGGVDSSVAALLLLKQGFNVIGLHMKGENPDTRIEDEQRVLEVCEKIGIECKIVEHSNSMQIVKDYFAKEYLNGRTPNPCVICNREVKFKPLLDYANQINADFFATGHYASIEHVEDKHILAKAKDKNKDQSYFLCQLSQKQLEKVLFPLGNLTKEEVRQIAEENGLITAKTKDSYDICFLGSQKFKDFMNQNYKEKSGDIVDKKSGKKVGEHTGISKYTIGQRRGLNIGGTKDGNGNGWFVVDKDLKKNILYVIQGEGQEILKSSLIASDMNWIVPFKDEIFSCFAKIRYRQEDQKAQVKVLNQNEIEVVFDKPQRAITVGQFIVLYDKKGVCLGGATIQKTN